MNEVMYYFIDHDNSVKIYNTNRTLIIDQPHDPLTQKLPFASRDMAATYAINLIERRNCTAEEMIV